MMLGRDRFSNFWPSDKTSSAVKKPAVYSLFEAGFSHFTEVLTLNHQL
jgi:hypothetical protein